MNEARSLTAINATIDLESTGGIATFLGGLISALGKLHDGDEHYLLVGSGGNRNWLEGIKGENQQIVLEDVIRLNFEQKYRDESQSRFRKFLSPVLGPTKRALQQELIPQLPTQPLVFPVSVPVSDGFWEELDCDVVHFPDQRFVLCAKPTIYNPHDLQHLHYPEYFKTEDLAWRESIYPAGCHLARTVVTASQWVKDDIIRQYGTDPEKIQVIPWAPPTQFYKEANHDELNAFRNSYNLPPRFALYPAVTWPHKNHLRLIEAIALVRDKHKLMVPLVCTGSSAAVHQEKLDRRIRDLDLQNQIRFLGFLPGNELRSLYRLCTAVVVPTLFEAASGPVYEAWQEGCPVACSTVTSLPEQVGDAGLLFNAESVEAIADVIHALFTNETLREEMSRRGRKRLLDFRWERTAKAYRAVYRRAARRELSYEDRMLLSWDWMKNPAGGKL